MSAGKEANIKLSPSEVASLKQRLEERQLSDSDFTLLLQLIGHDSTLSLRPHMRLTDHPSSQRVQRHLAKTFRRGQGPHVLALEAL